MLDIKEKRHITVVGRGGASNVEWDDIQDKPDFATVATSGSYNDLSDKPEIPGQVNADWDANSGVAQILNKPTLATVATSGSYSDLSNTPSLATVATSGSYNDLADKPTIPPQQWFGTQQEYDAIQVKDPDVVYNIEGGQAQANWTENDSSDPSYIQNKPTLATVATSGSYSDLSNTPSLATVATSGSYNDLSNKPTIPSAQVNSDWNASTGVQQILNKPTLATVATSGSYNDLSNTPSLATVATSGDYTDLSNKPEIPSVPAMTTQELTFTLQGGTTKTIEFYTVPNYFYVEDISGSNNTLSITKSSSSAPTIEVFKSTDKMNWESMGTTSTTAITATIPANGKLYLKANANALWCGNGESNTMSASGNHNIGGNIMSLLYSDDFDGKTTFPTNSYYTHSGFTGLFYQDTHLINANNLVLPITTMIKGAYNMMFQDCSNLLAAPTSLPNATMADSCYTRMFYGCTGLTTAPVILSTTTVAWCASGMFNGCTSLNSVTCYFTNVSPSGCISNWLNNVAAQGDFWNLGGATFQSGASGIPSGWTEHTSL